MGHNTSGPFTKLRTSDTVKLQVEFAEELPESLKVSCGAVFNLYNNKGQ